MTAAPAIAEMVFAIGAGDHLAGVSRFCVQPPPVKALPRIGGMLDPNLEAIDALAPDLILWQGKPERLAELAERRPYRLEVFRIESVPDVHAALQRLGKLFGREEQAALEIQRLESAFRQAEQKAPSERPRVLLVYDRSVGELGQIPSTGSGTFLSQCLASAGGDNCLEGDVTPSSWPLLSAEVPYEKLPQLIVELRSGPVDASLARQLREDWEAFAQVPAVSQGRIAVIAGEELLLPGPRLDLLVEKLSRAVRGELDIGFGEAGDPGGR